VIEDRIMVPLRWQLRAKTRRLRNRLGRFLLHRCGVIEAIEAFNASRPARAFEPDWLDLFGLYSDIRRLHPQRALEYGSGVSTIAMACALTDNGAGKLISLESEADWAQINAAAIPPQLRTYCEILYSPVQEVVVADTNAWRFTHAPIPDPDYIYLDGPPGVGDRMVTADPLDLQLAEHAQVVIDGRTANRRFLLAQIPQMTARYRSLLSNDSILKKRRTYHE
jgi:hypothetical protein